MERVTSKLTLPYVNYTANLNLLYGSGNTEIEIQILRPYISIKLF